MLAHLNGVPLVTQPVAPTRLFASLVVGLMIMAILAALNNALPWSDKVDDIIRLVVGIVVIAGLLSFFKPIRGISGLLQRGLHHAVGDAGPYIYTFVAGFFIAVAVVVYFRKPSAANTLVLAVLLVPFFTTPFMTAVEMNYIEHVGVPAWNMLADLVGWTQSAQF